ncbi:hypothetical protein LTR86_001308 [Recurvomyces mirabilis]|nr:hypothetical protein LTR86_001308 [Recurvomyces mirabilis]
MPINIPLVTIPLYYVLAAIPHGYAMAKVTGGDLSKADNCNPHGMATQEKLKKLVGPREFAAFERAESCHRNALENMPLFVAAIFAGCLAEWRAGAGATGVTTFSIVWMALRTAYTINYIVVETRKWAFVRSLIYFITTFWAFAVIIRAAFVFGS